MNSRSRYGMNIRKSLIEANDLGLVNGHITLNGWMHDIAEIRGLFLPPFFSQQFRLEIRFNGQRIPAEKCFWQAYEMKREGRCLGLVFTSLLSLAAGKRAAVMKITVANPSDTQKMVDVQYELSGSLTKQEHWEFNFPKNVNFSTPGLYQGDIVSDSEDGRIRLASSLKLSADAQGIFNGETLTIPPQGKIVLYTIISAGAPDEADSAANEFRRDAEKAIADARKEWRCRVRNLENTMPRFSSDFEPLVRLYYRSLLHLLLNEWNVPEWKLHPYYATGGINGGCCCSYLWNYGEPYQLWSILNPAAAREQLLVYLNSDLSNGYAFYPDDGQLLEPYYPVNQEKVLLLAYAYVIQTRDTAFLWSPCRRKRVIDILCEQAVMHDDLSKDAVLVDYGEGNHHLELRGKLRYDGILPDLNLRRCVNYRFGAALCRLAGVRPPDDFEKRAENLKRLIEKCLFDSRTGWFNAIDPEEKPYVRYTIQMFKALGWQDWALSRKTAAALRKHLNEKEFLGKYGMHSLAKGDSAYDPADIDNGGPGACISFAPAVADRLYRDGLPELAWEIFRRLLWLADKLPYWGDSHTADRMEYRRDTPLQCDIQGAALAQTVIFGIFGIQVNEDFSILISPNPPPESHRMSLKNIRLAGKIFSIRVDEDSFTVECGNQKYKSKIGGKGIVL